MSRALGLPQTTICGIVHTLAQRGFLSQDPETRKYFLGLKLYEYGFMLASSLKINQLGAGSVHRLVRSTGLGARLAIWDEGSVLVTLNILSEEQPMQIYQYGPRVPGYCSSLGKAVLALLPDDERTAYLENTVLFRYTPNTIVDRRHLAEDLESARRLGYSVDREEYILGLNCIGTPVFDHSGRPIAAVSIAGGAGFHDREDLQGLVHDLIEATAEISFAMGYLPEPAPVPDAGDVSGMPK
jgi:IclR family KDG regulon transcriptional repressor